MISTLAFRNIAHRPWRSVLLFFGYGIGVGVMIVLLAIGEALLTQARDEKLVGGGAITVLPEGLDIEVMKTGGIGGLFFSIDHSRFIDRQLLSSPRLAGAVRAVSPQIDGKLIYVHTNGRVVPARALGEIPDATHATGAMPTLLQGTWTNDDGDRRYQTPTPVELRHELDHFHLPPATATHRDSWAEWHYFNVLSGDHQRWAFVSFIVGGDVLGDRWGGKITITLNDTAGHIRRYASVVPSTAVRFSTTDANVAIGESRVTVLDDGRYAVHGTAVAEQGHGQVAVDLVVTPAPRAYFPGAALGSSEFISGYTVPGLRAQATGTICEDKQCERFDDAQSYHDHNWGVWQGVTWDWGAARAGSYTILYGRVVSPDTTVAVPPVFVYLVDSLGFRAMFRPKRIAYTDDRSVVVHGKSIFVPSRAVFADVRGDDTLQVELDVEHAMGTDMRGSVAERGDLGAGGLARPYFIQMKGTATIRGRVGGSAVSGTGAGFFETYR